jgi:hypothetical protein
MLALSALMLASCETSSGDPKLQTRIPSVCDVLAKRVKGPTITEKSDYRVVTVDALRGLRTANNRIVKYQQCEARVRASFEAGAVR